MARITRVSTVPSPTPASNRRTAGGRGWMLAELQGDALGDHPLLAAGVDEHQVFLAVVEEAEFPGFPVALRRTGIAIGGGRADRCKKLRAAAALDVS